MYVIKGRRDEGLEHPPLLLCTKGRNVFSLQCIQPGFKPLQNWVETFCLLDLVKKRKKIKMGQRIAHFVE